MAFSVNGSWLMAQAGLGGAARHSFATGRPRVAALLPPRCMLPLAARRPVQMPADLSPKCFLQARARARGKPPIAPPSRESARERLPAGAWTRALPRFAEHLSFCSKSTSSNAAAAGAWALPSCSRASGLCGVVLRRRSCKAGSDTASTSAQRAGSCIYSAPKQQQR